MSKTAGWIVESIADEAALKTRLNALRALGMDVERILFDSDASTYTIVYLGDSVNFQCKIYLNAKTNAPSISTS